MREALPIYCKTSAAWAGEPPARRQQRACKEWESEFRIPRENAEPEHLLVLGGKLPFERLLDELPRSDEAGIGWDLEEATRFGRYARRLWGGLLEREQVGDQ
jgi:hypothetical protein